ncbi:proteasome subunit alpha type-3 [Tanacetum coccineum]
MKSVQLLILRLKSGFSLNRRRNLGLDSGFNCGFDCCSSGSDGGGDGGEESEGSNESNLATVSKEEESGSSGEGGTEKPVSVLSRGVAGLAADERQIVARAKSEAYNFERPFGSGVILGGYDRDGPQLYMVEPSGVSYGLLAEHQRWSKVSEATTIRSSDSTGKGNLMMNKKLQSKGFEEHQDKRLWNSRTSVVPGKESTIYKSALKKIRWKLSSYFRK